MVELVRMVADALRNDVFGINKQLLVIPRDVGDPVISPIVRVMDITEDVDTLGDVTPLDWPSLLVSLQIGPTLMILINRTREVIHEDQITSV